MLAWGDLGAGGLAFVANGDAEEADGAVPEGGIGEGAEFFARFIEAARGAGDGVAIADEDAEFALEDGDGLALGVEEVRGAGGAGVVPDAEDDGALGGGGIADEGAVGFRHAALVADGAGHGGLCGEVCGREREGGGEGDEEACGFHMSWFGVWFCGGRGVSVYWVKVGMELAFWRRKVPVMVTGFFERPVRVSE